jgi:hypothetical protein
MPRRRHRRDACGIYLSPSNQADRLWHNHASYFISLLKAYYGKNATPKTTSATTGPEDHREPFLLRYMSATWPTERWKACL